MSVGKKAKAKKIRDILNTLFPDPPIPLMHEDKYTLLIAVLLSAQSTDVCVNKITPMLFARAKTPRQMVELTVDEIQDIIRPCGLSPRKAKAIWHLSQILLEKYQGEVPSTMEALEELPGVGHKTASVVMIQGFGKPAFPVDTHIFRCAKRWGLSNGKNVVETEADLKKLFKKNEWGKLHLQIIYFARKFCKARFHDCRLCPICSWLPQNPRQG